MIWGAGSVQGTQYQVEKKSQQKGLRNSQREMIAKLGDTVYC